MAIGNSLHPQPEGSPLPTVKRRLKFLRLSLILVLLLTTLGLLLSGNVDKSVTGEDKTWIRKILLEAGVDPPGSLETYEEQLTFIQAAQKAVLKASQSDESDPPARHGIPLNHSREPRYLYEFRTGACYDRSRVLEKILQLHGFRVRHVFVLFKSEKKFILPILFYRNISSHACSEVLTKRGWLLLESNTPHQALDYQLNPVAIAAIHKTGAQSIDWHIAQRDELTRIFSTEFTYYYGLYSRHGRFYPPYNCLPDINWFDFLSNHWF